MVSYNRSDLDFILTQIKIAEQHAAGTQIADLVPNSLLPWGLRTVDGTLNNIIPGREEYGSADNPFSSLTDSSYREGTGPSVPFDVNGDTPGGVIGNTDYASAGSVVDTAPRTISNLIVDQTLNNPAAIVAALEYAGITGAAASAARDQIVAQYSAIEPLVQAAAAATTAESNALAALNSGQAARNAAAAADAAAQSTVAAYTAAIALAPAAETAAEDARDALNAFAALIGPIADPGDLVLLQAVIQEAQAAQAASALVAGALGSGPGVTAADLAASATALANAAQLVTQLQDLLADLQADANVVGGDVAAVAALGITNAISASGVAASLGDADSLAAAQTVAGQAAADLATAEANLTTLEAAHTSAVANSDAADAQLDASRGALDATLAANSIELSDNGTIIIPNVAPDEGHFRAVQLTG